MIPEPYFHDVEDDLTVNCAESCPAKQSHVHIDDGIFFLKVSSKIRNPFTFPNFSASEIFGNSNPVNIEYCSGNGGWIAAKAAANPSINWVAVEYKFSRICKIWGQVKRRGLKNLFIVNGEAEEFTADHLADSCVSAFYINFPDPWPKRRHAKNRIISPPFVRQVARILKPGGALIFVTDAPEFSEWSIDILNSSAEFESIYPFPCYKNELAGYGNSFFEELMRSRGKKIFYHHFQKTSSKP